MAPAEIPEIAAEVHSTRAKRLESNNYLFGYGESPSVKGGKTKAPGINLRRQATITEERPKLRMASS